MSEMLRPLPLSELRLRADGRHWRVDQAIAGLESLTPVQGEIQALHHGTALEISGWAETIVTLRCDRCLQHFNHQLRAQVRELVELRGSGAVEADAEIDLLLASGGEDLDDRLDPNGVFDPEHWLFEQLSLRLPLVNRCGEACPGPDRWSSEPPLGDPRWAALAGLAGPDRAAGASDRPARR